jgi:hypothetical protein
MDSIQCSGHVNPKNYPLARWRHPVTGQRVQSTDLNYRPGSEFHFLGVYILKDGVEIFSSIFSNVIELAIRFSPSIEMTYEDFTNRIICLTSNLKSPSLTE